MWILLAIIAISPFEKNPYLYLSESFLGIFPDFTMIKLLGLMGLGWSMMKLVGEQARYQLFESKQAKAFGLFLGAMLFAAIASGAGIISLTRLLSIVFFLPLVLIAVRTERNLLRTLKATVAIMILIFPYAIRQMMRFGGRLGVGFYTPNHWALNLLLFLPLPIVFARQETVGWKRVFWTTGVIILFTEVVLAGSRGAFFGLLMILPLIAFQLTRHRILALGGAICLLLLPFMISTNLGHRLLASGLDEEVRDAGVEGSDRLRLQALKAGLRMVQENPLTGVGLGNFKPWASTYGTESPRVAHNTYVEIAAELGLPALAAFLWLLYVTFASLRRSVSMASQVGRSDLARIATAMRIGLAGYLVSAAFLSAQFETYFWLIVFLSICFERVAARLGNGADRKPMAVRVQGR